MWLVVTKERQTGWIFIGYPGQESNIGCLNGMKNLASNQLDHPDALWVKFFRFFYVQIKRNTSSWLKAASAPFLLWIWSTLISRSNGDTDRNTEKCDSEVKPLRVLPPLITLNFFPGFQKEHSGKSDSLNSILIKVVWVIA